MPKPANLEERFWSKVDRSDPGGCWIWTGLKTQRGGYGHLKRDGKIVRAHRFLYERMRGPIPEGLELDHLCRTPACINPDHLEPVTHRENLRRWSQTITHCPQGHAYDERNTRIGSDGGRDCRTCCNERARRYHANLSTAVGNGKNP